MTAELDSIIPASRSDKDRIELDGRLNKSFCKVQDICKNPQTVFVPRKTDKPFIVEDAAPSHGPVINHEGTCCSTPRPRLHGRTMQGRPFERRNPVQPQSREEDDHLVRLGDIINYHVPVRLGSQWRRGMVENHSLSNDQETTKLRPALLQYHR